MAVQRYHLTTASGTRAVDIWYDTTTNGDKAVIVLPNAPAVWLVHQPRAQVYWWTTGERGLTVSLADAHQRLAMVQECGRRSCGYVERAPASS
jgi:hypothetical protein